MAKAIEVVLTAVEAGHTTSRDIAEATGIDPAIASARLLDLECAGLIERQGVIDEPRRGGRLISWRRKGQRGW